MSRGTRRGECVRHVRVLRRMLAAHLALDLVYRGQFVIFMAAAIAIPVMSLLVWRAALAGGAALPVSETYLTTYFVVLSFVTMATSSWMATFLAEDIRLGRLSSWLIRPAPFLYRHLANNVSEKLLKSAALLPMIAVVGLVFADSLDLPASPARWTLFAVSTVFAAVLVFVLDILIGSLAFWWGDITSLSWARMLIANLLSGAVVPLALMPAWAQGFVTAQPFRFTVSFPVEIVTGDLSAGAVASGFALQVVYVVLACVAARFVWKAGLRAYSAVGA